MKLPKNQKLQFSQIFMKLRKKQTLQFSLISWPWSWILTKSLNLLILGQKSTMLWTVNTFDNPIKNDIVQCALGGIGYLAIPTRTWSKSDRKMTSITVTTTRNIAKMRQNLLPYCRSGNFLSTFKQSTPRKWNLKTAKSIRVVLFRKYAWKLVKNRPQSWLKADKFCFS